MFEQVFPFILKYKFIFIFYLAVIIFLLVKRKKLDVQAKFILLYRMKFGLNWMERFSKRFREWVILLGYVGVGAGYVGLVFISVILIKNLYDLIAKPAAVSGVSLVLPGINVPGLGVLPFWYWIIVIFVIALVHEFSHGIVARAHNITVKNTGIVFFGPILGAFVEPDEKTLQKQSDIKQYSVLAAGSFSNILLAIAAVLLLNFIFMPIQQVMVEPTGFTFDSYIEGSLPFEKSGILPGTIITGINGETISDFQKFRTELLFNRPGSTATIQSKEKNYEITLAENPDEPKIPYLGITGIRNEFEIKEKFSKGIGKISYHIINWSSGFLRWLFLLSLGIGLFNLLPLPIVDGGRMTQVFLHKWKGREKGERRYRQVSAFFLLLLLLNLFFPLLNKLF